MSKEMVRMRAEQEVKKAAELKAKLDMVELRDKPAYGRPPRKIGEMVCGTGFKTGYREATVSFVLRLDAMSGEFFAEHGDYWYVSKSRDALKAKMDEVAKVALDLEWRRYLHVKYEATVPYNSNWQSTTSLDLDDKRGEKPILGIHLAWEVVEYSNAIRLPGDDDDRYMKRAVNESGDASPNQESVNELPSGLIPHTAEREALLQSLRGAFASIDKKMVELLKGSPDQVAKRFDNVQGPLLLAAPKKKVKP